MAAITAELALEVSKFQSALQRAQQSVRGFKANTEKTGAGLGATLLSGAGKALAGIGMAATAGVAAAAAGLAGAAVGLKNAFDLGGALSDVSAQIGTGAGRVLVLQQAFKNAGMEAEDVGKVVGKMQKTIVAGLKGGSAQESMFKNMGLDPAQLASMDPSEAFEKVGVAIAAIENPTQRAAASMEVFGRTGGKLLTLFGDSGALADAKTMLGSQVEILDQSAGDFDKASDILGGAFRKIQGFFVGMGSRIVGALQPFLEEFNKIDLAGIGQRFGDAMVSAFQVIKATIQELTAGDLFSLVGDALVLAFKTAVNVLWAGFWGWVRAVGQYVQELGKSVVTIFSIVTTAEFWKGLGNALMGIALAFDAAMFEVIAKVLAEVKKIPVVGKVVGNADKSTRAAAEILGEQSRAYRDKAGVQLDPLIQKAAERFAQAAHNVGDAFKRGYEGADNVMDASAEQKRIADAVARISERAKLNQAQDEQNKKPAAPAAMPGEETAIAPKAIQQRSTVGALAGAVNLIMGRSANELILDESKKQTNELQQIKKELQTMNRQRPALASNPPPVARPVDATPRFA